MAVLDRPGFGALPRSLPLALPGRGMVLAGLVGLALLGLFPVLQSSGATTAGFTVQELESRREELRSEISNVENEVGYYSSLNYIQYEAENRLGMVQPTTRLFVPVGTPAPPLERLPARYQPRAEFEDKAAAPWWQPLADLFAFD